MALKASAFQEIWPSPSRVNRPCYGQTFLHPATEHNPALTYDNYGYCNPAMSATTATAPAASTDMFGDWGGVLGKVLLWGGLAYGAYWLWTNRSTVAGYFK